MTACDIGGQMNIGRPPRPPRLHPNLLLPAPAGSFNGSDVKVTDHLKVKWRWHKQKHFRHRLFDKRTR